MIKEVGFIIDTSYWVTVLLYYFKWIDCFRLTLLAAGNHKIFIIAAKPVYSPTWLDSVESIDICLEGQNCDFALQRILLTARPGIFFYHYNIKLARHVLISVFNTCQSLSSDIGDNGHFFD